MEHQRRSPATPSVGSGSRSRTRGLRLFGRGQGKRQFFQGAEVAPGRLSCRPPGRYRKRTRRYRPGAGAGTAYGPVAGFDPAAVVGSRGSPDSARRWLFGNLLQYWHQQIFLLLSCFSVRPKAARTSPAGQFAARRNRVQAGYRRAIPPLSARPNRWRFSHKVRPSRGAFPYPFQASKVYIASTMRTVAFPEMGRTA
jgi:hypothetical protein